MCRLLERQMRRWCYRDVLLKYSNIFKFRRNVGKKKKKKCFIRIFCSSFFFGEGGEEERFVLSSRVAPLEPTIMNDTVLPREDTVDLFATWYAKSFKCTGGEGRAYIMLTSKGGDVNRGGYILQYTTRGKKKKKK